MLKGTLDDFTLPDIFRLMSLSKKTGTLTVERSAGQGKVFFRDGEVYYAQSSLSKEPLGQKLVKAKVLTEGQLRKALDLHAGSRKRLGEVLMESGMVDEEQIMMVVRQQIEDAAFDLLRWELGEFLWEPGAEVSPEVPIYVTVENLIMEASRRLDELEVIQRKIPSPHTVLAMAAAPPEGAVEINITPEEWRILVLVNGVRTVREIGEMVGLDDFSAMRTLYGLVSAGLIEVPGHSHAGAEEPALSEPVAVAEPEPAVVAAPEPVAVAEPEPEPVAVAEPEPTPEPVAVAEPEPTPEPVAVAEPEPTPEPVAVAEPEPTYEPMAVAEPTPEPMAVAESDPDAAVEDFFRVEAPAAEGMTEPILEEAAIQEAEDLPLEPPAPQPAAPERFAAPSVAAMPPPEIFDEPEVPVEAFDAPAPGELMEERPAAAAPAPDDPLDPMIELPDPAAAAAPPAPVGPPAPTRAVEPPEPQAPRGPAVSQPSSEAPRVDRSAAVRELAGLFSDGEEEATRSRRATPAEADAAPDTRKRVEDDEQVTRGLISRLIDGVKGL